LIYITFWFDGKFYSRTCSGVDLLSGVHTTGCQPLHLLSRTVNEGIDWIRDPLAESHDTSGLYPETVNEVNDWVKVPLAERLSDHGGQCTFGVSEGVAPAPYSATRFGGWGGGKERQIDSDLSQINVEDIRLELYIC
jgi:hypothetical protein